MLAVFHVAGVMVADRFPTLATALHGVGTIVLGGAIFLSAQIFNLQEHWPGGVLLWAIGACMGMALLRDWVQTALVAILIPAWLASEWIEAAERFWFQQRVLGEGLLLLSVVYLTSYFGDKRSHVRRALGWIGGLALIPCALLAMPFTQSWYTRPDVPKHLLIEAYLLAYALPLLLAYFLRGRGAWINAAATLWVVALALLPSTITTNESTLRYGIRTLGPYVWCGVATLALIASGIYEARRERINLGVIGFGITILAFYFSEVMDKLSRSTSLMGLGLLFLVLAWSLEKTRKKLLTRIAGVAA